MTLLEWYENNESVRRFVDAVRMEIENSQFTSVEVSDGLRLAQIMERKYGKTTGVWQKIRKD